MTTAWRSNYTRIFMLLMSEECDVVPQDRYLL